MRIDILTIFPELLKSPFEHSIIKRAIKKKLVKIYFHDIRDFASNKHNQVDDYSYGGGAGMVMMVEPIAKCIENLKKKRKYDEIIFMTPDGNLLDQKTSNHLSTLKTIMILCGHYKGVDERVRENFITKEISVGKYVLSGGELPAAILCDTIIRLIPGVLSDETSALSDSFQDDLLSPPVYTRPAEYKGLKVPDVLLSGNDKEIRKWRHEKAIEKTGKRYPDMLI
ncbi:MAG: tRNA (guanosine(37)-N1)-methyltransferase TrmD [Bacteroidales bacterium]|nr:tRNA (guanosine(37)-N1)-methyltransferase TrmD [Bacteroidales bacterium]